MKTVFVSGCYDLLHAGHLQFFADARALGDHLTVCFASAEVLWAHKQRHPSLPDEHKQALLASLEMVDHVVLGTGSTLGLDFEEHFLQLQPDILAVTEDDQFADAKQSLCERVGAEYRVLPKTPPKFPAVTSTELVRWIRAPRQAPLRLDFAGGWLDVPRFAITGAYVVNCAVSPLVSLNDWPYQRKSGMGGSGAYALLVGHSGVDRELAAGVGWQDPAVIAETGLCVWHSGPQPWLEFKRDGQMLAGRMAIQWTGTTHDTPALVDNERDYAAIAQAAVTARDAVLGNSVSQLAAAVTMSYECQLAEGMNPLADVPGAVARKYCGSGWGGYAMVLFADHESRDDFLAAEEHAMAVEPYLRPIS